MCDMSTLTAPPSTEPAVTSPWKRRLVAPPPTTFSLYTYCGPSIKMIDRFMMLIQCVTVFIFF